MSKLILASLLLLTFFSCSNKEKKGNQISKVSLAFSRIGCYDKCPNPALSIDDSLNLSYFAGGYLQKSGFFKGKISQSLWDSIQVKFNKFIEKGLDSTPGYKTDQPGLEFFVHDASRKHQTRFALNSGELSNADNETITWFLKIPNRVKLIACDSLSFETTYQYYTIPYPSKTLK